MTDLNKFFKALSERAYKENDLSDVTYSMCESNKVFRQFFLDFFFPSFNIKAEAVTITREEKTELGRPDFYIRSGKEFFIVEVKIWDGNHHFEQYKGILDEKNSNEDKKKNWERLGYIANYEGIKEIQIKIDGNDSKPAKDLCPVCTWKDFVEKLEKEKVENSYFDDSAISAYVEYVKRVCPYDDFKLDGQNLNISGFKSVQEFENAVVGKICALEESNVYNFSSYYKSPRYFISQHRMGHFFEFDLPVNEEKASDPKRVWGWIGAYYRNGGAVVCVEFEDRDGWGKPVCDKFREKVKDGCLRFYLKEVSAMKTSIPGFLRSVLDCVVNGKCVVEDSGNISNDVNMCKNADGLLGMKILPGLLEQKFFAKNHKYEVCINGNDKVIFNLEMSSGSDTEVPNSHCGRYFELKPMGEDEKQTEFKSVRGWIGVMYSENKNITIGDQKVTASTNPTLIVEITKSFADRMPNKAVWYDDDWGWKCKNVEIENESSVDAVVNKIEETIWSLFGQKSTISSVCSVGKN